MKFDNKLQKDIINKEKDYIVNHILVGRSYSCKHWVDNCYALKGYSDRYRKCNVATEEDSNGLMGTICSTEGVGGGG